MPGALKPVRWHRCLKHATTAGTRSHAPDCCSRAHRRAHHPCGVQDSDKDPAPPPPPRHRDTSVPGPSRKRFPRWPPGLRMPASLSVPPEATRSAQTYLHGSFVSHCSRAVLALGDDSASPARAPRSAPSGSLTRPISAPALSPPGGMRSLTRRASSWEL